MINFLKYPPVLTMLLTSSVLPAAEPYEQTIRPVLAEFCLQCHSTEKHKGDLDLERFATFSDVKRSRSRSPLCFSVE